MIWFKTYPLADVNRIFDSYMTKLLEIKAVEIQDNLIKATMPITNNVRQPFGILHGGASVVLAESIGSVASNLIVDPDKYYGVGLDINANHVKSATEGLLTATCLPLHIGKTTHVWDIKIHDDKQQLICISRLTVAIVEKK
ncbi:hotdog fold thioesterase [Sphingobacterium sp. Mn56C]|uniref:hotdog fold thioesterase n=1 Tax=Sphingobacterium sp. Mn56C TaxID=3395261 RepID=UPI003BED38CB